MAKPYGDIGKEAKDLFSQEFVNNGLFRVTHQSKNDNLTIKSVFTRQAPNGKESAVGSFEPKVDLKPFELTAKLTTSQDYSLGVNVKDVFGVQGVKVETNASVAETKGTLSATLIVEKQQFYTKLNVLLPASKATKLTGELSFPASSANLGVKAVYGTSDSSLDIFPSASFMLSSVLVTLSAIYGPFSKKAILSGSLFHKYSASTKLALDANYDLNPSPKQELLALSLGGEHRVDDSTLLKAKLKGSVVNQANEARLSIGLKQKLSSNISATFGLDLNVFGLLGIGNNNHSFGAEIKID